MLSGSCWARYIQGESCLSIRVCAEHQYRVYSVDVHDEHLLVHMHAAPVTHLPSGAHYLFCIISGKSP